MARRKKSSGVKVNLGDIGSPFKAGEEYLGEIVECTLEEGSNHPYFAVKIEGTEDNKGSVIYDNVSTSPAALWRLRSLVEGCGIDIPEGDMDLEPDDFVGKTVMFSTFEEVYEGKKRVKVDDYWSTDESPESEEEESEEEESEDDSVDLDALDDEQIMELGKALKLKAKNAKLMKKKIEDFEDEDALKEAYDEVAGEEDEEEEEKEESSDTVSRAELNGMSEEELEEVIEEHELDVDLGDFKTLKKKRAAVIAAAEEEEILED